MITKNWFISALFAITIFTACSTEKDYLVTIHTDYGDMHAVLYDETPKHKENFIKLSEEGFYDSLIFHRIIENFMIQGGDPESKNAAPGTPLGSGGPGYTVPAEFVPKYHHKKGALSAARLGDQQNPAKASSGSQFYIVQGQVYDEDEITVDMQKLGMMAQQAMQQDDSLARYCAQVYQTQGSAGYAALLLDLKDSLSSMTGMDYRRSMDPKRIKDYTTVGGAPHLDDEYTVFGEVIDGLDIIDKIAVQPTDQRDRPLENITFTVTVEQLPKSRITKEYGYEFPSTEK